MVMCAVLALGSTLASGVFEFGRDRVASAEAQSIADAVALAGVLGGRLESDRIAAANGAEVVTFLESSATGGSTVLVVIDTGSHEARARASNGLE